MFKFIRSLHAGILLALAAGILGPLQASAVTITYTTTSLGGSSWQYNYIVTNDGLGTLGNNDIEGIQIFFDYTKYDTLAVVSAPAAFNASPLVFEPVPGFSLDGIFDVQADPGPGIANGFSLGGFSVSFDWLVGGTPGVQAFEIYDPSNFAVLETGGVTEAPPPPAVVPVPAAVWLFGSALAGLGAVRRRRSEAALS